MPILEEPKQESIRGVLGKIKERDPQKYEEIVEGIAQFAKTVLEGSGSFFEALDTLLLPGDPTEIYKAYAEQLGKDELTDLEKRQAIINHVLKD